MMPYKVIFKDNRVIAAHQLEYVDSHEMVQLSRSGDKRTLESLVIYGFDKNDVIQVANGIIRDYLTSFIA